MNYSFTDLIMTVAHPYVGRYEAQGEGVGSVQVQMSTDRTSHDIAADGSVMVSKVRARNGTVAFAVQQTSNFNVWLSNWFKYLETAPANQWAETLIELRSPAMGIVITCTGVSPQKQADRSYQATGQQVTWTMMVSDIDQRDYAVGGS